MMMKSKSELYNEILNTCGSLRIEAPVVHRDIARERERNADNTAGRKVEREKDLFEYFKYLKGPLNVFQEEERERENTLEARCTLLYGRQIIHTSTLVEARLLRLG